MANTNTPVVSSHQHRRLLPTVTSTPTFFQRPSNTFNFSGMAFYNCMPKTIKRNGADPIIIVQNRPSFVGPTFSTTGMPSYGSLTPFRGGYLLDSIPGIGSFTSSIFTCAGNTLFAGVNTLSTSFTNTPYVVGFDLATIATNTNVVVLETTGSSASSTKIYTYDVVTQTLSAPTTLSFKSVGNPQFINGRVYILETNSNRIYNSAVGSLTSFTPANDFIDAEMHGDEVLFIAKHKNHLVAFGNKSIEFFYDAGIEIGSPLQRQESYAVGIGAYVDDPERQVGYVTVGDDIYFMGSNEGIVGVYRLRDFKVTKISDAYMDLLLESIPAFSSLGARAGFRLCIVNSYGRPQLLVTTQLSGFSTGAPEHFCYDIEENVWGEWGPTQEYDPVSSYYFIPMFSCTRASQVGLTYMVGETSEFPSRAVCCLFSSLNSQTSSGGISMKSSVVFESFDDNNAYQKHIKFVDVIGTFNSTTVVSLESIKDATSVSTYVAANDSSGAPIRFRNLGRGRKFHFRVSFESPTNFEFRGLDISYNQGTH